ncbi:recombinase family protein [Streptomyces sp. NPDC096311]|uniref:recombinase family protein n=1 Tax=Streptomyces sp. NPDC096311 TaxID=3366083 RepID=UPI00380A9196
MDSNRSAWQRNRKRPGWEEALRAMGDGEIRRVVIYHPDRLMRQPKDLEEPLSTADDKRVLPHGEAYRRDLSDPDDRFILRIEVAHDWGGSRLRWLTRAALPTTRHDG